MRCKNDGINEKLKYVKWDAQTMKLKKKLKDVEYVYIIVWCLVKLDYMFLIPGQDHMCLVTKKPVIKSYNFVIILLLLVVLFEFQFLFVDLKNQCYYLYIDIFQILKRIYLIFALINFFLTISVFLYSLIVPKSIIL